MFIIGSKYDNKSVDFETLIGDRKFANTLFIFNDNYTEHWTSKRGRGNAKIRQYNHVSGLQIPRSFGIPTGYHREGYHSLDQSKDQIDQCFEELNILLRSGNYNAICYSIDSYDNVTIGSGIFKINHNVKKYITERILSLGIGGNYFFLSGLRGFVNGGTITNEIIEKYKSQY